MDISRFTESSDWRARLILLLCIAATLLVTASAATAVIARFTSTSTHGWFWSKVHETLDLGVEFNLPTWFASIIWGLFGSVAWYLSTVDRSRRGSWRMMAAVGAIASIDEYLRLHDRLSKPSSVIENAVGIDLGGATWVLMGSALAVVVVVALARFVLSLESGSRRDLIVGGGLFLLGAIGFEAVSNLAFEASGNIGWVVELTMHIEESLELAGVILAIRGLLRQCGTTARSTVH